MASLLSGTGFITGAASGIGRATAYSFAKHGVRRLALSDINMSAAEAAARDIKSSVPAIDVIALKIDVTSEASVNDAVEEVVQRFGKIDFAVNNAGIGGPMDLSADHDATAWSQTVNVDLTGVWLSSRAEIRAMLSQERVEGQNRGAIVNVASMYGLVATSQNAPVVSYTAAKHGVIGLTRADAIAYASQGVRINAVCPGYVATPLVKDTMPAEMMQREVAKIPAGRMAEMDEIADHITFLSSPLSSYMYGSAMVVDGGFTIQ